MSTRRGRGQALAELALTMPLMAMIIVSLFDFGMVLYAHIQVANAAREGARAASLYRSQRYEYVNPNNYNNPRQCTNGIDGWSLLDVAQQAIVTRSLDGSGNGDKCRDASGTITASALGWLPADPTPAWTVTITPAQTTNAGPSPGDRATLTLSYPYRLIIISKLVPALSDPLTISKSVNFEYTP
jgi:Flp pilus assembly protein TadG